MLKNNFKLRYYIRFFLDSIIYHFCCKKIKIENPDNTILFMLACDYNNVGDMQIAVSQEEFLRKNFPDKDIICVRLGDTYRLLKSIKKQITKNTIVTLTGGGNTDDKYTSMDRARNKIISKLKNNSCLIVGFPQTIDYSDTPRGKFYFKKSQYMYNNNRNFIFIARERKSYDFAIKNYECRVLFMPDIVLSTAKVEQTSIRSGVGAILRSDSEKNIDDDVVKKIFSEVEKRYNIKVEKSDMMSDKYEGVAKQCKYIKEKFSFMLSKKIIITDRLHGMIFCYITNTPCLVFKNSNHKIVETYLNWLSRCNYIVMAKQRDSIDDIMKKIGKLMGIKNIMDDNALDDKFCQLRDVLSQRGENGKS